MPEERHGNTFRVNTRSYPGRPLPYAGRRRPLADDIRETFALFDEIHKYKDWKNYLKGAWDRFHQDFEFLVTGSGRLDLYQKGGDSLAGRYFLFHFWPFTLSELGNKARNIEAFIKTPLKMPAGGKANWRKSKRAL